MADLIVVMPAYNEEGAIAQVLTHWAETLSALDVNYLIVVYNDGSNDGTLSCLNYIAQQNPRITIVDKLNSGHGPTILKGYCDHIESPWIFQIDSDGELGPSQFGLLWEKRDEYEFLIGKRIQRRSSRLRKMLTWASRCIVWLCYGQAVFDVNCPYRLFRPAFFGEYLQQIPKNTFAPNLIISGIASHLRLRIFQANVVHTERMTGEVSIRKWKLLKAALISSIQTVLFRVRHF